MIVILHSKACEVVASRVQADLAEIFHSHVSVKLAVDTSPNVWPGEVEWNDLLIVLYDESGISISGNKYVRDFLDARRERALILPVAFNSKFPVPPASASAFKALSFDENSLGPDGRLIRRVGAMLGLCLQGRSTKIFISYRAKDGSEIAEQIYQHLLSLGHNPWRDEAQELDGYTKILPGVSVQQEIEEALSGASLVLLLDTPKAPESKWIKEEIDTANGMLIPILPIVFRTNGEGRKGPRFRALLSLQRWVDMPYEEPSAKTILSAAELDTITSEIESYLCDIFVRKCRVPFLVEKSFRDAGYDWHPLDHTLLMFKSYQRFVRRIDSTVLSHCSIFDQIYDPARIRFKKFLQTQPSANHSLFVYDGELWAEEDLDDYLNDGMIVLHHQELSALLASNFTKLGDA